MGKFLKSKILWTITLLGAAFEFRQRQLKAIKIAKKASDDTYHMSGTSAFLEGRGMEYMYATVRVNYELLRQIVNCFFEWNRAVEVT